MDVLKDLFYVQIKDFDTLGYTEKEKFLNTLRYQKSQPEIREVKGGLLLKTYPQTYPTAEESLERLKKTVIRATGEENFQKVFTEESCNKYLADYDRYRTSEMDDLFEVAEKFKLEVISYRLVEYFIGYSVWVIDEPQGYHHADVLLRSYNHIKDKSLNLKDFVALLRENIDENHKYYRYYIKSFLRWQVNEIENVSHTDYCLNKPIKVRDLIEGEADIFDFI